MPIESWCISTLYIGRASNPLLHQPLDRFVVVVGGSRAMGTKWKPTHFAYFPPLSFSQTPAINLHFIGFRNRLNPRSHYAENLVNIYHTYLVRVVYGRSTGRPFHISSYMDLPQLHVRRWLVDLIWRVPKPNPELILTMRISKGICGPLADAGHRNSPNNAPKRK